MFGIGGTELVLILIFGFLIFGPDKLPAIGRTVGRAMRQFRNAQEEMNKVIREEVYDPSKDTDPLKNPFKKETAAEEKDKKETTAKTSAETFAERKARLAREREEARNKTAEDASAASDKTASDKPTASDDETKAAAAETAAPAVIADSYAVPASDLKPSEKDAPSADELYGNKPATDDGKEGKENA